MYTVTDLRNIAGSPCATGVTDCCTLNAQGLPKGPFALQGQVLRTEQIYNCWHRCGA